MAADNPKWQVLGPVKQRLLGDPLQWTDEELALMATLSDADVERIIAQFNKDSDYTGLMGGDDEHKYIILFVTTGAAAGLAWNYARLRSDGKHGPPIAWKRIRFDVDNNIIRASKRRMADTTERLIDGSMNLADWQTAMAREVKYIHSVGVMLPEGGPANLGLHAQAQLEERLLHEYQYLYNFADEIALGKAPLTRRSVVRAQMYADAGRGTYEEARRDSAARAGFDEERRMLGQADHCGCCIEQAEMGWQPKGTLKPIGECTCLTNCHCTFIYRNSETGEEFI